MSSEEQERNQNQLKDVELYAGSVDAWYNTKLEHDKSLLALSSAGVGVLVALLTTVGVRSAEGLVLNILALTSFLLCIGFTLWIFKHNAAYVEKVIQGTAPISDPWLAKLDTAALVTFLFGVVLTAAIGVSAAINSFTTKGATDSMSNDNKQSFRDSFNGVQKLSTETVEKSYNGAPRLVPQSPQGSAQPSGGSGAGTSNSTPAQPVNSGKK